MGVRKVPVYCYQCVAGPDLLKVVVEDGVAIRVEPNYDVADKHPALGRICVKAYGLIQKTYNPNRIRAPLKRANPKKGKDQDPMWVEISWGEALQILADRLLEVKAKGLTDENGYPRLAVTIGSGGIAPAYMGTLPALFNAWGVVDYGIGSGQGVKCYHSEHLYGELWHRAFTVAADTPNCRYIVSFGHNTDASGGVAGVWRHAEARANGLRRVQVEPHLSVTGATSDEWIPIKPKTDAAFLLSMIHVILHENDWRRVCDLHFLKWFTNSPYLVGPNGYFLRDPETRKPLVLDPVDNKPKEFDDPSINDLALDGAYEVSGIEIGPDGAIFRHTDVECKTAFQLLAESVKDYTPEWASKICDVPASAIRKIANEFLQNAMVGANIVVDGRTLPYRPVAILLGKNVSNGWGGYGCCWARTILACLVGALEVPGGIVGTTVRLAGRPGINRVDSVKVGPDGFMDYPFNRTERDEWASSPRIRNAYKTLLPLAADSSWSPALGPTHLTWMFMKDPPENWPRPTPPDIWIVYRANPPISHWSTEYIAERISEFPFIASFAYTIDETNWYADLILPESTDLESLQLYRVGGTSYIEQFWEYTGYALRQPVIKPVYDTMDMTDIATELAERTGMLKEYYEAINRGVGTGVRLKTDIYDYSLRPDRRYSAEEIWDRVCRAATMSLTNGREERGLDWFKEYGVFLTPFRRVDWYLHPVMEDLGLRYEVPYQERLKRIGEELKNRLHERGAHWWDKQLEEYEPIPGWRDFPGIWSEVYRSFGKDPDEYPFWMVTSRSMQYAWGSNVSLPIMADVAKKVLGHFGIVINSEAAKRLRIKDGDEVWIESPIGRVKGRAVLRRGIRPDVVLAVQQFGHWRTPFAKDLKSPNLNELAPLSLELTDATGSGADLVRVKVYRA